MSSSVEHARLKSLFSAYFEQRNYKSVFKQASKVLEGSSHSGNRAWAKVFLSMSHWATGQLSQAIQLIEEVVTQDQPKDSYYMGRLLVPAAAQLGREDLVLQAYSQAMSHSPDDPAYLQQMFTTHLQLGDYQAAGKLASQLQLPFAQAACVFLQVRESGAPPMMLTLAERMLERLQASSADEVYLVSEVLLALDKRDQALALLTQSAYPREADRLLRVLELQTDRLAAQETRRQLLQISCDDWLIWQQLQDNCEGQQEVDAFRQLVMHYQETQPLARGPRLAQLRLEATDDLLLAYFERYGHKGVAWEDLSAFEMSPGLVDRMASTVPEVDWETHYELGEADEMWPDDEYADTRDGNDAGKVVVYSKEDKARWASIVKRVTVEKLRVTVGTSAGAPLATFVDEYEKSCTLYRKHLEDTEAGPNDDLLMVSFARLRHGSLADAVDAATAMRMVLANTRHDPQSKVALLELYSKLGALNACSSLFFDLEVKHVLCESLAHLALYAEAATKQTDVIDGMRKYRNESISGSVPRYLSKSFQGGKWIEVDGFLRLLRRQRGSFIGHLGEVEREIHLLLTSYGEEADERRLRGVTSPAYKSAKWAEALLEDEARFYDNSDRRVLQTFSKERASHSDNVPEEDVAWLRLRVRLFLALEAAALGRDISLEELTRAIPKEGRDHQGWGAAHHYEAIVQIFRTTAVLSGLKGTPPKSIDCNQVNASLAPLVASVEALQPQEVPQELAADDSHFFAMHDNSFVVHQVLPICVLLMSEWAGAFPNNNKLKKVPAEQRKLLRQTSKEVNSLLKKVVALCDAYASRAVPERVTCAAGAINSNSQAFQEQRTAVLETIVGSWATQIKSECDAAAEARERLAKIKA